MTQEEKQLLLVDLCARLPYHPHIWVTKHLTNIELTPNSEVYQYVMCEDCKPYLRPMSSMTEEEKHELYNIRPYFVNSEDIVSGTQCNTFIQASECQDWLNAHHFDYRGLIEKGLALEAKEGMYKTE